MFTGETVDSGLPGRGQCLGTDTGSGVIRKGVSEELSAEQAVGRLQDRATAGRAWTPGCAESSGPRPGPSRLDPPARRHQTHCELWGQGHPASPALTCSQQPPALPGVPAVSGPEHIKVIGAVGGGRGSLKRNAGRGTRVTLQPGRTGWGSEEQQGRAGGCGHTPTQGQATSDTPRPQQQKHWAW